MGKRHIPQKAQMKHPDTGRWWLINMDTQTVLRSALARWPDVPVIEWRQVEHPRYGKRKGT